MAGKWQRSGNKSDSRQSVKVRWQSALPPSATRMAERYTRMAERYTRMAERYTHMAEQWQSNKER